MFQHGNWIESCHRSRADIYVVVGVNGAVAQRVERRTTGIKRAVEYLKEKTRKQSK